ncbi:MAG: hypothetical protein ACN6RD_14025 [Stenotrophomonas maltophilia]
MAIQIHSNIQQEIVEITTDKLRLIMGDYIKRAERRNEWQTALGILLAAVAALVTTEFKLAMGVEGGVWKSLFIIVAVASAIWLTISAIRSVRHESIDSLIRRIKNEQGA